MPPTPPSESSEPASLSRDKSFSSLMWLEPHGPDTYVGASPEYPFPGLYGGQVVAQALRAAHLTVKEGYAPHSLHAYFLREGDPAEPVRFEVERLRDGRSFVARQVVARQSTGAILNMSASFQVVGPAMPAGGPFPDAGPASFAGGIALVDLQRTGPPAVPGPEAGTDISWSPLFELRLVQGSFGEQVGGPPPASMTGTTVCAWIRVTEALPDDPPAHAEGLAYESDSFPAWVVRALLADAGSAPSQASSGEPTALPALRPISLDHAMWFHRPFRADGWLLFTASAHSFRSARGLAQGRVFSPEGALVATVSQEALLRRARPAEPSHP